MTLYVGLEEAAGKSPEEISKFHDDFNARRKDTIEIIKSASGAKQVNKVFDWVNGPIVQTPIAEYLEKQKSEQRKRSQASVRKETAGTTGN